MSNKGKENYNKLEHLKTKGLNVKSRHFPWNIANY